jgi:hypothetical protein
MISGAWAVGSGEGWVSGEDRCGAWLEVLWGFGVIGGTTGDILKYFVIGFWVLTREAGIF